MSRGLLEARLASGRRVLALEASALASLAERLDERFAEAVGLLLESGGRVLVSGVGKSGIVARKIAATLTSTGTPALFLHPVEALHGDLGIVGPDDVALLVSKSGDTAELSGLVEHLVRAGVRLIALTGRPDSALARDAQVVLDCAVAEEACPMNLAPTTSTTAALAMGDALAVAVLEERPIGPEDFARWHPGGALGRSLRVRVADVMVREDCPRVGADARMRDCIVPLAEQRGTVPVVDGNDCVVGVVTAGDLTRLMEREEAFLDVPVRDVMTTDPKLARPGELGVAAVRRMEEHGVMALPVVDEAGVLQGIVHLHDLMRSGVV
ncbi:MAG: KpsF/GutQ family sugar-phosphate isomerase [Gemmatimonadetes bacterium]|nr:MAG: KpsF/GutQ family sugar-phosphate isomerase [Gemmatimonadota bacterium]